MCRVQHVAELGRLLALCRGCQCNLVRITQDKALHGPDSTAAAEPGQEASQQLFNLCRSFLGRPSLCLSDTAVVSLQRLTQTRPEKIENLICKQVSGNLVGRHACVMCAVCDCIQNTAEYGAVPAAVVCFCTALLLFCAADKWGDRLGAACIA